MPVNISKKCFNRPNLTWMKKKIHPKYWFWYIGQYEYPIKYSLEPKYRTISRINHILNFNAAISSNKRLLPLRDANCHMMVVLVFWWLKLTCQYNVYWQNANDTNINPARPYESWFQINIDFPTKFTTHCKHRLINV